MGKLLGDSADLPETPSRYESSAYFLMELGGRFACRSNAATIYDGGPMTDPWALDNTGIDEGDSRDDVVDLGYMAAVLKAAVVEPVGRKEYW